MFFGMPETDSDFSIYALRRKDLCKLVQSQYSKIKSGIIVIFAGFEGEGAKFRQDSSFYYLTGVKEPGAVLVMDLNGTSSLYLPSFLNKSREKWTGSQISGTQEDKRRLQVNEIKLLGKACSGYQCCSYGSREEYKELLEVFVAQKDNEGTIFTLYPSGGTSYCIQRFLLDRFNSFLPNLNKMVCDISPIISSIRRRKDLREIELMYKAVEITELAQEAAAQSIDPGVSEKEVQASLEYMITGSGAQCAFPSIVASGESATILHYIDNHNDLNENELVIVDIGAEWEHYCADITRTYPVSGVFTPRQRELYDMVLDLQTFVASQAKPGYWLNNKEQPEKSLHHIALDYLDKKGYADYMNHGIGHFLGMDVHDVGDYTQPLQEGDVITIEPGVYIPQEKIGIRIEDDYWIAKDEAVCLSESLPKKADEIEKLVQQKLSNDVMESEFSAHNLLGEETDA